MEKDYNRRSGRTTRIVDEAIQHLFKEGYTFIRDHYTNVTSTGEPTNSGHSYALDILVRRLVIEHNMKPRQDFLIDIKNFKVTLKHDKSRSRS